MFYSGPVSFRRRGFSVFVLCCCAPSAFGLELSEAEALAAQRDPVLRELAARSEAISAAAVASGQLPDPELRFGALNFPADDFDRDQEPMTQLLVGFRQRFPRGDSRSLSRARGETLASAEDILREERERDVVRAVRAAWFEAHYQAETLSLIEEEQAWFRQFEDVVQAAYAQGRRQQHELLRLALETDQLEAEAVAARQALAAWKADLERWIGPEAGAIDLRSAPELPVPAPPAEDAAAVRTHPSVLATARRVDGAALGVEIARQSYRPGWALDVSYGFRDGENPDGRDRPDFLSAMVSFDVPLFTKDRQDRQLAAASADERAGRERLAEQSRSLRLRLATARAAEAGIGDRLALFDREVLPAARANVEAVRQAYRNDRVPFDELVRAERTLLTARMQRLRLLVDARINRAELLYLAGESS
jgi:outer membrane protein TolC